MKNGAFYRRAHLFALGYENFCKYKYFEVERRTALFIDVLIYSLEFSSLVTILSSLRNLIGFGESKSQNLYEPYKGESNANSNHLSQFRNRSRRI